MMDVKLGKESDAGQIDEGLATRAAAGDADALEALLAGCESSLREALPSAIEPTFRSAFDIDDVIQITFIEAFLHIGTFTSKGRGSFLAWLRKLAENNLRDATRELRRAKRIPRHRLVAMGTNYRSHDALLANLMGTTTSPSQGAIRVEVKSRIEEALSKAPPDYGRVIRLMDLDGLTAPQAAKELNRSVGGVYMLRVRAHACLREIVGRSSNFFSSQA